MGHCKPFLWDPVVMSIGALVISPIPGFLGLFLPVQDLHGDFVYLPPHTKWQHKIASHVNI